MKTERNKSRKKSLHSIQQYIFRTQLLLVVLLAVFLTAAAILMNIYTETEKRDQNLQNVAETVAHSQVLTNGHFASGGSATELLIEYLDSLKTVLSSVDVISVVSAGNIRLYHSNPELIGTVYDGTLPDFTQNKESFYATNDSGPSGTQRRAYAAIYDGDGNYVGFVMAVTLMENIHRETLRTIMIYALITTGVLLVALLLSVRLSKKIRKSLLGYEPDVFSAMYKIRDNILESLDEGIIAVDRNAQVQFANDAAAGMLGAKGETLVGRPLGAVCGESLLAQTLRTGEKEFGVQVNDLPHADILIDRIPIKEGDWVVGAVGILHDRAEYTKLMEDLSGTQYLVDSMRANNHDFTNKLHVILGLIQMEMYNEATSYIENITIVQRETLSRIMRAIDDPSIAALLIGKTARASELNVKFTLREGCAYSRANMPLPAEALITIIGNLIDNALEAMNGNGDDFSAPKELLFGMYSQPGALLITVDDTGPGIPEHDRLRIFENGFSTKGTGRGTGLYQVKKLVEGLGGTIAAESQEGAGTSFSVSFKKQRTPL